ncbi:TetR/AcrR family transcriptional regulator [Kutzneria sp. 744]|uniref:TetR/AcrR family transcriptional regulator n=1 Tax=Kutzneria sp. (strain 744) TaxID=345341 RepID=UPI0003EECB1E|nr:TetR/AcrR family transcriptional regulator [Kutzneria sp. 744]EWM15056.1 transcriptional regulator, TetR family [Kutzneria sp. 744]
MAGKSDELKSAGRPRDPEADEAILRAALELFAERGVDGTSIEQIAKRAGVARLTVYRRWSSKEELLAQAIAYGRNAPDLTDEEYDTLPYPEVMARMLGSMADSIADRRLAPLMAQLMGSTFSHPELFDAFWAASGAKRRDGGVRLVRRAIREGMLPADADPDVIVDIIIGAVFYRMLVPPRHDDVGEHVLRVLRQVGFRPTP